MPSPMNLAMVIERFNPTGGGAERSTAQIVQELLRRGHRLTVITACCPPNLVLDGAKIHQCGPTLLRGSLGLVEFSRRASNHLASVHYDASLSVTLAVPATAVQPRAGTMRELHRRRILMRSNAPLRALKQSLLMVSPKQHALLMLERRTLRDPRTKRIIAISRYMVDQLRRDYHIAPDRIDLIPNAANMPHVDPGQRVQWRRSVRQGFGIPDDSTAFLFAAMDPKRKGFVPLMHAARLLRDRSLPFTLILAGRIRYAQQHLAASLSIRDHVRFVGTTERMAELYCAADVTVLPTYYDPSSKVVIESLMMGTPAISSAYNGASEFIVDGTNPRRGRIVAEPNDIEGLAQAMAELTDAKQLHRCRSATEGIIESLSMRRHVDQLEVVLASTASG